MKIISLNIAGRKQIENRIPRIVDFLEKEKADIVCFQEVTFSQKDSIATVINNKMGNPYKYEQSDLAERFFSDKLGQETSDGLAVLSSLKIVNSKAWTLRPVPTDERGRPDFHRRIAEYCEFANGLKILNVHFASNANAYLQLEETLKKVTKDTLIIGDYNIFKSNIIKLKPKWGNMFNCSIEFQDYISVPNDPPTFNTVDYLLLPKDKLFSRIRTVNGLSDHSAIIYEFT